MYDAQTGIGGDVEQLRKLHIWLMREEGKLFAEMIESWRKQKHDALDTCPDDDDRARYRCQIECKALARVRDFPLRLQEALKREAEKSLPESGTV